MRFKCYKKRKRLLTSGVVGFEINRKCVTTTEVVVLSKYERMKTLRVSPFHWNETVEWHAVQLNTPKSIVQHVFIEDSVKSKFAVSLFRMCQQVNNENNASTRAKTYFRNALYRLKNYFRKSGDESWRVRRNKTPKRTMNLNRAGFRGGRGAYAPEPPLNLINGGLHKISALTI